MRDTTLVQSQAISLSAQRLAGRPDLIQEQMRVNNEQVAEMQRTKMRLTDDVRRLRGQRDFLKRCVGGYTGPTNGTVALLRVELLKWLLYEARYLVLEIEDEPILIGTDDESEVRRVAAFIAALLFSEEFPGVDALEKVLRQRCRKDLGGCGLADCSCGAEPLPLDIPKQIVDLLAEVNRGS